MGRGEIIHKGRVTEVTPSGTTVEIISEAACASCHAKGLCGAADAVRKAVSVPTDPYSDYQVGEAVEVVLDRTLGNKAVWLAYAVPLLLLLLVIGGLLALGVHELVAGLSGIGAVALWYLALALMRDSLAKDYVFRLRKYKDSEQQ